jgi:hypothetical protein
MANLIDLAKEFTGLIEAMLRKSVTEPGVLHVSPTRVGGILIDWEDRSMQHEVELNPDCSIGFLHLNKATGCIQSSLFHCLAAVLARAIRPVLLLPELGIRQEHRRRER